MIAHTLELHLGHIALVFLGLVIILQLRANSKKLKNLLRCANEMQVVHTETSRLAKENATKIFDLLRAIEEGKV